MEQNQCIFCKIVNNEVKSNIVYENDQVMCILDINPINQGHILIIPKEHLLDVDDMKEETAIDIMKTSQMMVKAIKRVFAPDGYSIMQNGGDFNDIGHYHMHVFPRFEGDGFGWHDGGDNTHKLRDIQDKLKQATRDIV